MTPEETQWRSIFSVLLKDETPEVGGRAAIPDELRTRLELLAKGDLSEKDIQQVCEKIILSPEAMKSLAFLLQEPRNDKPPDQDT